MSTDPTNADIIHQAFFLGWSLLELKDRVQINATPDNTSSWEVGLWQAIFRRIALLQVNLSIKPSVNDPTGTIFDISDGDKATTYSYLPDGID
jgi:hypothetical protein